ncbi:conserved membrane domain protein, partial [Chlamydia psittaci 84-8471/1]
MHGTSLIKTANQKISFLSIFHALGNKIGACLCLNPESDSKAGWVFAFVLSAIITVLLCIILLPVKLILLGL